MTAFLTETPHWVRRGAGAATGALLAALWLAGLSSPPALAQQQQPIQLLPLQTPGTTADPVPGQPPSQTLQGQPLIQPQGQTQQETQQKQDIEVGRLQVPSPDSIGLVAASDLGLGPDPWAASDLDFAIAWLDRIPSDLESPTLRGLVLRLLIAAAPSPRGAPGTAGGATRYMEARLGALMRLGAVAETLDLAAAVPRTLQSSTVLRLQVEAWLARDAIEPACRSVRQAVLIHQEDAFWPRALILCQLVAGEIEQALLGLELLNELDPQGSALFSVLAGHMAGGDAQALPPGPITPVEFAAMGKLRYPLPPDLEHRLPPALYAATANAQNATPLQRAWAAEQALQRGLLDAAALAEAYGALPFDSAALDSALTRGPEIGGVEGRALLYQALQRQTLDIARAGVMRASLAMARADGELGLTSRTLVEPMAALPIGSELAWFAGDAASLFYAEGILERARAWDKLLRLKGKEEEGAEQARLQIWPYARLRGHQSPASGLSILGWVAARDGLAGEPASRDDALLLAAFSHLGIADPLTWTSLADDPELSRPEGLPLAFAIATRRTITEQRLAAFLLLAAGGLGAHAEAGQEIASFDLLLEGLTRFGLWDEARALAVEVMMQRGF